MITLKDLPEDIRVIAEQRRKDENDVFYKENYKNKGESTKLSWLFRWRSTPEGESIWSNVYHGNFKSFYEFHNMSNQETNNTFNIF